MPDMTVRTIEDTNLKMLDFEAANAPKEIHFEIEGEFYLKEEKNANVFKSKAFFKSFFYS